MDKLSKRDKKKLRYLVDLAYKNDLSRCLDVVYENFKSWKSGENTVWDLEQHIHEFHNKTARDLYKSYVTNDPVFAVAFGIRQGVISLEEVPDQVKEEIKILSGVFTR